MNLLAIDTSTEACSAALHVDDATMALYELAPRRHAELILPMVDQLLTEAEITLADLDAIAFGRGPGSFTGVRIATGVAQGLAFAAALPLIPISSLAALAQAAAGKAEYIAAIIDARMGEVYYGLYRGNDAGIMSEMQADQVLAPGQIRVNNIPGCFGVGSGWAAYGETLVKAFGKHLTGFAAERYPDARHMVPLALQAFRHGELESPEDAAPVYLRNKVTG